MIEWSDYGEGTKWGIFTTSVQIGVFRLVITRTVLVEETKKWKLQCSPHGVLPEIMPLTSDDLEQAKIQAVAKLQCILKDALDVILEHCEEKDKISILDMCQGTQSRY